MRTVLEGTLLACGKTRTWSKAQERKAQQVLSRGIRRALGVDRMSMWQHGYSDEGLRRLVHWDSFEHLLHRQVLRRIGHVARMPISRLPKIAVFVWPTDMTKHSSARFTYPMWAKWLPQKHGIPDLDWFRLAQKPTSNWLKLVDQHLPRNKPTREQEQGINAWSPADPLPVSVTTAFQSQCLTCLKVFVTAIEAKRHKCPAKIHHIDDLVSEPPPVTLLKPLDSYRNIEGWAIYTDGSGPTLPLEFAGWGIAIWSYPLDSALPDFELFGPVPLGQMG